MGIEKRQHPRTPSSLRLYAVNKGRRISVNALNVSLGGAFLATESILRPGTVLLLEPPADPGQRTPGVAMAARVVHFTMLPGFGAGVSWIRAMAPEGMAPLRLWLRKILGFEIPDELLAQIPPMLWTRPLYWDFRRGRLFVDEQHIQRAAPREGETSIHGIRVKESLWDQLGQVRVVYSEAPSQKRASVHGDVSIETRAEEGQDGAAAAAKELNRWLHLVRKRTRADLQAIISRLNVRMSGRVLGLDAEGLFVEVHHAPPPPGNRLMVDVKIEFQEMTFPVRFACEVEDVVVRRDVKSWGMDLRTISVNEGSQRGILRAWLAQQAKHARGP
ncbi:MAG: PilZ domain-containing protein [Deltaproteobacteria bacterium]|nr:PilZ domain-containing protein [Deltaproteobacteria bacterium]